MGKTLYEVLLERLSSSLTKANLNLYKHRDIIVTKPLGFHVVAEPVVTSLHRVTTNVDALSGHPNLDYYEYLYKNPDIIHEHMRYIANTKLKLLLLYTMKYKGSVVYSKVMSQRPNNYGLYLASITTLSQLRHHLRHVSDEIAKYRR